MKRLLWLLPLLLVGCTGGEVLAGLGILAAAWKGKQMIDHPVAGAIAENPAGFWSLLGTIVTAIVTIFTLLHKAGRDHKRKER